MRNQTECRAARDLVGRQLIQLIGFVAVLALGLGPTSALVAGMLSGYAV